MADEEIVISGRGEGKTTFDDILEDLGALGAELESLAGRGYTIEGAVQNGVLKLIKPDPLALNDRERLAAAFMELENEHGFAAPISLAWEADCLPHALQGLEERYQEERAGVVFWYAERDDMAFGYRGYSSMIKEEYDNLPHDKAVQSAWVRANVGKIEGAEISERLQHNMLVRPLWVYWGGDPDLIISVFKKHGLNVHDHAHEGECIYVYPSFVDLEDAES